MEELRKIHGPDVQDLRLAPFNVTTTMLWAEVPRMKGK
jgi:hypothetical protein